MPSVGSTPTTCLPVQPSQQQSQPLNSSYSTQSTNTASASLASYTISKQQPPPPQLRQYSLPLQLQYQVTTTQPSLAGTYISRTSGIMGSTTTLASYSTINFFNNNTGDISPISSTCSFSSADTNQTLLNSIINQRRHQQSCNKLQNNQMRASLCVTATTITTTNNSTKTGQSYRSKYSQFMIITPAVSIDRDFEDAAITYDQNMDNDAFNANDDDDAFFNSNGNIYRSSLALSSINSSNSSDSGASFHSNYNPYLHTSRQHLLPKSAPPFCTFYPSAWRWCSLICLAMRCFGSDSSSTAAPRVNPHSTFNSSFIRPPYYRSRSSGAQTAPQGTSKTKHKHLRSFSISSFTPETAFEHFSAPFKSRKTPRDHLNNVTYEL